MAMLQNIITTLKVQSILLRPTVDHLALPFPGDPLLPAILKIENKSKHQY